MLVGLGVPYDLRTACDHVHELPCVKVAALLLERWRARHVAFAMGLHPRLGGGSSCCVLDPEVVGMVLEAVDGK